MQIFAVTKSLILREVLPEDEARYFEMDADPGVHRYVGNQPVQRMEEVRGKIQRIRMGYTENGIDRWAVVEKESGQFIGWAGLRLIEETRNKHTNYYDLGYRLMKSHWGRGFASEAAVAALNYGFTSLELNEIYASADSRNVASIRVLTKAGFKFVEQFDSEGVPHGWFRIDKDDWTQR